MESLEAHNAQASSSFQGDRIEPMAQAPIDPQANAQLEMHEKLIEMQARIDQLEHQNAQVSSFLQGDKIEDLLQPIIEVVNERFIEMEARHDKDFKAIQAKIDRVSSHFEYLDALVSRLASSLQSTIGMVGSNSRGHCHAISVSHEDGEKGSGIKNTHRKQLKKNENSVEVPCIMEDDLNKVVRTPPPLQNEPKVEHKPKHELPISNDDTFQRVEENLAEVVPTVKKARRSKRKRLRENQVVHHQPNPPSLTFIPLKLSDGKLECKVKSRGASTPFSKARVVLASSDEEIDWVSCARSLGKAFGIKIDDLHKLRCSLPNDNGKKLGDRGPLHDGSLPLLFSPA